MNNVCKKKDWIDWVKVSWARLWVKCPELSCSASWHLFWWLRCSFLLLSWVWLGQMSLCLINHKIGNMEAVSFWSPSFGSLGPWWHDSRSHLPETQLRSQVLFVKRPDILSVLCLKLSHTTKWTWLSCWLPKLISLLFIQISIMDETCNFKIRWVLTTYLGILQSVPGTFMKPSAYTPDDRVCQALC